MDSLETRPSFIEIGVAALLIVVSLVFYVPLLSQIPAREAMLAFFWRALLPAALLHLVLFLLITRFLKKKARAAVLFLALSAGGLLCAGGWRNIRVFAGLLILALLLEWIGNGFAQLLMPEEWNGWGISLAFGIAITSVVASFLMLAHLLRPWLVGAALLLLAFLSRLLRRYSATYALRIRRSWTELESRWNSALALSLEVTFLVVAFSYVAASPPEHTSDAMRFYWPYVKLLKYHSGFFNNPYQAPYIIPQAGLAYASTVFLLLGKTAVRWSMFLAWFALVGIASRRRGDSDGAVNMALAAMLASCPVVLNVTTSLMQDSFVILSVVVLGMLCVMGKNPDSTIFWLAAGASAAVAWNAKYSTAAYAAPLLLIALIRAWKTAGWKSGLRGAVVSPAGFLFVSLPWLWHAYQTSGNPIFPFLSRLFPSPLWPQGVGVGNLETFRLSPGTRDWFLWPLEMTYRTSRFVEGYNGYLGLSLLVLLIFAILSLLRSSWRDRALILSAVIGTALLWSVTVYVRYWLAALWLVGLAVQPLASRTARNAALRLGFCALAVMISLAQIPFSMASSWLDPKGWPWDFYTGRVNESQYISRAYPGFDKLQGRPELNEGWPRVWSTGYEAAGHFKVEPMDALIWEIQLHGIFGALPQIKYLASAGSKYWIVNRSGMDAKWLTASGIGSFFWDDKYLVESEGPVAVYRLKPFSELQSEFNSRLLPGSDLLLDGGFEKGDWNNSLGYWRSESGGAVFESKENARAGRGLGWIKPQQALWQASALPSGLSCVELVGFARAVSGSQPITLAAQLGWSDDLGNNLGIEPMKCEVRGSWREFRFKSRVPAAATYASVYLTCTGDPSGVHVDEVHLYSQNCR